MRAIGCRSSRWRAPVAVSLAVLGAILAQRASSAPPPNLSGTWAAIEVYSGHIDETILGTLPGRIVAQLQVEIVQSGSVLVLGTRYCTLGLASPLPFVTAEIPSSLLISLDPAPGQATLEPSREGLLFRRPWQSRVSGARVAEDEPLPVNPQDPRVLDEDGDGHPGVTLRATIADLAGVDLYLVIRMSYRLSGVVVSPDRIEGLIEWSGDILLLGGSLPFLPVYRQAHQDPDPQKSVFVLSRIGIACTCPDVIAELEGRARP